ncbi:hypothetical protein BJF85_08620 [Saccharomonospora sp. CUA-673]|uniref:hypothetical protein n=1 Tax=Saccharomonospora sp. CUA-673 TaxID=1904969 RepID=UPI000967C26D|nr:hypothetical protein [Saccharomonospora sp. CUA-673]OLT38731.1 hypothetical protein BJF85_08620 [Saccharomonospora sp. CUA-673]
MSDTKEEADEDNDYADNVDYRPGDIWHDPKDLIESDDTRTLGWASATRSTPCTSPSRTATR